jgi:hypothetical protein
MTKGPTILSIEGMEPQSDILYGRRIFNAQLHRNSDAYMSEIMDIFDEVLVLRVVGITYNSVSDICH